MLRTLSSTRHHVIAALAVLAAAWCFAAAPATAAPTGLFATTDRPRVLDGGDRRAVEVGVRLRVTRPGTVTGLRFYRSPGNRGVHVGSLWSATSGARLATATFRRETRSGWQTVRFARPVRIVPGRTYVASYFAPRGGVSTTPRFVTRARVRGPVVAPRSSAQLGNGVFAHAARSTFPRRSGRATNYWVDVMFTPSPSTPGSTTGGRPLGWTPTPPAPTTCDRSVTPATLASQFAAASAGQTICLAAGDYGSFAAGSPTGGAVTVRPATGVARGDVTMELDWSSVRNVRVHGVTISGANLRGATRDVLVSGSRFTGIAVVDTSSMTDANVVFDGNDHYGVPTCGACFQGQLHVHDSGDRAGRSGVVARNSRFGGSFSDGVRADASNGMTIEFNEFTGIDDTEPYHSDPIQLYGGQRVTIRGNWFHDMVEVVSYVMVADGSADNVVVDNVFEAGNYSYALTWLSDDGSLIHHNTFATERCFTSTCAVFLGAKPADDPGSGTVIRDNVINDVGSEPGRATFSLTHNLIAASGSWGSSNLVGRPTYTGGASPTTWAGFRLAPGSPGSDRASDGLDVGIR